MRSAANRARLSPLIIEDDFGRYWAALAPSHVGPFVTALTAADVLGQATARCVTAMRARRAMSKVPPERGSLLAKWQIAMRLIETYGSTAPAVIGMRILDHHNRTTGRCNPSYSTMAKATRMERETAFRAAARLEREGWLRISKSAGRSNSFDINWSRASDSEVATHGDPEVTTPVTSTSLPSDSEVTAGGDLEVTQNTEDRNTELIHESKLEQFIGNRKRTPGQH